MIQYLKYTLIFFKSIINELLVIFLFVFIVNNYFFNSEVRIAGDGIGYYDYLPSIFIHHDFIRYKADAKLNPEKYARITAVCTTLDFKDKKVDRYFCGTAVLQFPFFYYTYLTQPRINATNDGYQKPYQDAVFYAAVFYLFLAIFFLKRALLLYKCSRNTIVFVQLLLVLGTSVTFYADQNASYSHIYSLFAISSFIYFVKKYFTNRAFSTFIWACLFLGLIVIIRPINGIIIFSIPFIAGSFAMLKEQFLYLMHNLPKLLLGVLVFVSVISIQIMLWYLQTGYYLVYTYGDVGFDFLHPQIINVLFSFRKGLFVYTPMLLFAMVALIWLAMKRRYYELITWYAFFLIITYFISSWTWWDYGAGFGMRPFVEFFGLFFMLFALMFDKLKLWVKLLFAVSAVFFIYLNIIQTYQYKMFILDWQQMDKQKYCTIFMETSDPYIALVLKKQYDYQYFEITDEVKFGDFNLPSSKWEILIEKNTSSFRAFDGTILIQVGITNEFRSDEDASITLAILDESDKIVYYLERYLIHFNEKGLNQYQAGFYNFELPEGFVYKNYKIRIGAATRSKELHLKNVSVKLFKKI